ncbi:MAG: S1 RNA-binding domain-containing protein [Oscillospiraceae bacterium]|nr:S1 RNA-binding domain-containing protein [Oscillospiraceae bacterium]
MEIEVGAVLEGTVTSIAKFGAFVSLPDRKSGLVHISEIAAAYVADVNDFLQVGQTVKVKVLAITPEGKINLSIKRAEEQPQAEQRRTARPQRSGAPRTSSGGASGGMVHGPTNDASFEDRLKHFMQESDSRIAGNRLYSDRNRGRRRGK